MTASITAQQRYWWKVGLELKLRKSHGDSFQEFFSATMAAAHGVDFVRVRPFGSLGDKGCDGYLQSCGQVFQCYGVLNGTVKVSAITHKMGDDFSKAAKAIPAIMKEWHMAHNMIEGLPIEAVEKLHELRKEHTGRKFGFFGIEGFEEKIFSLERSKIEDLLGCAATIEDSKNLEVQDLRDLVSNVADAADTVSPDIAVIRPVPPEKLNYNKLPNHWRSLIAGGWQNAPLVDEYLNRHADPLLGERLAHRFHQRYEYLKAQSIDPGAMMSALYEDIVGIGSVSAQRQVAAQALLAFLFESCDIFEAQPDGVSHDLT
jgi:hypothetical protein